MESDRKASVLDFLTSVISAKEAYNFCGKSLDFLSAGNVSKT